MCLGRWLVIIIFKNAQSHSSSQHWNPLKASEFYSDQQWRTQMTFGKGALLWLIGIPLPIILLLALFWR